MPAVFEIGNSLREARVRQGLDFAEVELATKIRAKYIRALEDEQFEVLPRGTYIKGFLRSYAEYLGLDGQLYVDEYNSRFVAGERRRACRTRASRASGGERAASSAEASSCSRSSAIAVADGARDRRLEVRRQRPATSTHRRRGARDAEAGAEGAPLRRAREGTYLEVRARLAGRPGPLPGHAASAGDGAVHRGKRFWLAVAPPGGVRFTLARQAGRAAARAICRRRRHADATRRVRG